MSRARDVSDVLSGLGSNIVLDAGVGVDFDGGVLDDYEEGTWAPQLYFNVSNTTVSTTVLDPGIYVKIGSLVIASTRVRSGDITSSQEIGLDGLPFLTLDDVYVNSGKLRFVTYSDSYFWAAGAGSSRFRLFEAPSGTTDALLDFADITSASNELIFSVVYRTS